MKAETDQGDKAFDVGDKPILMRQPLTVVTNVASSLMGNLDTIEDAEKTKKRSVFVCYVRAG